MTLTGFDTNILAYLSGVANQPADAAKVTAVQDIVQRMRGNTSFVAPAQAIGELVIVLRRAGDDYDQVIEIVKGIERGFKVAPSNSTTLTTALSLAARHKLQFWDSIIMVAAVEAGCSILLSEDMQHGFVWQGMTIINPLADDIHPRLAALF